MYLRYRPSVVTDAPDGKLPAQLPRIYGPKATAKGAKLYNTAGMIHVGK